jgi:hypothetical protein
MKKLIISLLILAGYINLQAQLKSNDLIKENLSGNVKKVVKQSTYNSGVTTKKEETINRYIFSYNQKGFLVDLTNESSRRNYNMTPLSKSRYKYDHKDNLIEEAGYDADEELSFKKLMRYDSSGKIIDSVIYNYTGPVEMHGKITDSFVFKYEEKESMFIRSHYSSNISLWMTDGAKTLTQICIITFDDKGNNIEEKYFNGNRIMLQKIIQDYNEPGRMIKKRRYIEANEILDVMYTFNYDDSGNLIEVFMFDRNGTLLSKNEYEFDNKKNIVEEYKFQDKRILDDRKNLEVRSTFKYEFDKYGNWIKKTTYIEGMPYIFEERSIEYY